MTVWSFGIVQTQELERAGRHSFEELCDLVSEATGIRFRPMVATSYTELAQAIERREVGLAWLPPIPTIELEAARITTILAIPARHGTTTYHSALIVRRGGPRTLADLRTRRAVWVQRDSAAGYIVPRMHLASQGIDVLRYFSRELFVHSHSAVIDALVNGEADVGATYCHIESYEARRSDPGGLAPPSNDGARRPSTTPGPPSTAPSASTAAGASTAARASTGAGASTAAGASTGAGASTAPAAFTAMPKIIRGAWIDDESRAMRPIDVLATFGPIPNDALVASNDLSASARSSLARWLLDPSPMARQLFGRLVGSSDFRVPSPMHFDPLKHMLRAARARKQDAMPSSSRTGIRIARRTS